MPVNGTTLVAAISSNSTTQDILLQSAGAITAAIVFGIIVILGLILALVVKFHKPSHGFTNTTVSQSSRHTRSAANAQHRLNGTAAVAASSRRHNTAYSAGVAAGVPAEMAGSAASSRYISPYGSPQRGGPMARTGGLLDGVVITQRTQAGNWEPARWPRITAAAVGAQPTLGMDDLPTISRFDDATWPPSEGLGSSDHYGSSLSTMDAVSLEMTTVNSIEDLLPPDYPTD